MKKKHAPLKELKKSEAFAKEILRERGFILPKGNSAIDTILHSKNAPTLPGIPAYLPYPWLINATRRIIYDLGREWQAVKKDAKEADNIAGFIRFVIGRLNEEEAKAVFDVHETVRKKEYDFKYLHRRDSVKGVRRFIVDSFAVSVVVKSNADTAVYLEWFYEWTERLLQFWPTLRNIDAKQELKQ